MIEAAPSPSARLYIDIKGSCFGEGKIGRNEGETLRR